MQIVIDIPERTYEQLKFLREQGFDGFETIIDKAVANGTPLPKGHGRVIDYGYVVDAIDDWINAEEYNYTNATDYLRNRIRNVPTIIDAESEDKE